MLEEKDGPSSKQILCQLCSADDTTLIAKSEKDLQTPVIRIKQHDEKNVTKIKYKGS